MAKQSGLGDNLYVGGINLSGDIGSIGSIAGGPAVLEVTPINKSGFERLGGLRDGRIEFSSFFNDAVGGAHPTLKVLPIADVVVSYWRGTLNGGQVGSLIGKQINYDPTRGNDGSLLIATEALANSFGLEWGRGMTDGDDSIGGASSGGAIDFGAEANFGLQAYLHVFGFTGTSATVAVQDSADGSTGWADVVAFAAVSGVGDQRVQSSRTENVKQFLRWNITGTFSSLIFALSAVKNETAVVF
jgi:hypothetical protein